MGNPYTMKNCIEITKLLLHVFEILNIIYIRHIPTQKEYSVVQEKVICCNNMDTNAVVPMLYVFISNRYSIYFNEWYSF